MKSGLFRRFSVHAAALVLIFGAANAAGGSTNRLAADSANGTLLSSFEWHAHRVMQAIGSAPYLGDLDAGFVAHLTAFIGAANRSAQDHDAHLRHIAEQIADGRTKEIGSTKNSMKKVPVPPWQAAKTPVR
ncbi:hypothetical protein [Paraburkholderia sp. 2C]